MDQSAAFDIEGARWVPISEKLIGVRRVVATIWLGVPVLAAAVLAILLTPWLWIPAAVLAVLLVWAHWLIPRQVRATAYAELPEDLAIRRGIMFRTLTVVPYGRMQYVEVSAGPLAGRAGIAEVQLHTASAGSDATIPGLPKVEAERLRDVLSARGEARLAGL